MADFVIGFDFGNYYAQLCCIEDMDPRTRRGGTFRTLLDSSSSNPVGFFLVGKCQRRSAPVWYRG